jgi:SAM-dependent methyltransferase
MWEQSKAARRRYLDGAFQTRFFVGEGIDIGAGNDPLGQYRDMFPAITSIRHWDMDDGDAQELGGLAADSFDFVHSSHCLEHMKVPMVALTNWLRILKPGGHLIVTVPDEDLYELGRWPSHFNPDHKWTFTIHKEASWSPVSVNILNLAISFSAVATVERIVLLRDFFREELAARGEDQTMTPVAECSIEFVLSKRVFKR